MAILLTGGTGTTGRRIAPLLHKAGHVVYIATRSPRRVGHPYKGIKFDWENHSTWENPFSTASAAKETIDAVYLVAPYVDDMGAVMNPFIDLAKDKGVKRFVLLSAGLLNKGDGTMGVVHEYLDKIGVDYCALRPSWFQENFAMQSYVVDIITGGFIVSAAQDGRLPWISADDIADAAVNALTAEKVEQQDLLVLGPELLSYDGVASLLTEVLGKPITHKRLTEQEMLQAYLEGGMPESVGAFLSHVDTRIAQGEEEALTKLDNKYIGHRRLRDFIVANKHVWSR